MPANDIPQLVARLRLLADRATRFAQIHARAGEGDWAGTWGLDALAILDALAALQSPPPPEAMPADAALWPLVERWQRAENAWMSAQEPDGQAYEPAGLWEERVELFDALLTYRPPSAPALAVTPTAGPWPMTIKTHFWCPECAGPCCVDEDALCAQCGADVVASGTPEAAALDSPPPPETQP